MVFFLSVGPSLTVLFWPHVPWDVPTTEGAELVHPRAGTQNMQELSLLWLFTKPVRILQVPQL